MRALLGRMTGRKITAAEHRAAEAVVAFVGGTIVDRDVDGAPDKTVDFDVLLTDGRVVALEITAASDPEVVRLHAQAFKFEWPAPLLLNDWQIGVKHPLGGPTINLRPVQKGIESILVVFEHNGVANVGSVGMSRPPVGVNQDVTDATTEMFNLGVTMARVHRRAKAPGKAMVLNSIHGGHGSNANEMNELVEINAMANIEKLRDAEGDEKHLFVWIDSSRPEAELAMHLGQMPFGSPTLPEGLNTVWVGSWGTVGIGKAGFERLLRIQPSGEWEMLDQTKILTST